MVHTFDVIMMIRLSTRILSIITREMGKLNAHNLNYRMKDNWENWPNLRHTLDSMYLVIIFEVQYCQIRSVCIMMKTNASVVCQQTNTTIGPKSTRLFVNITRLHSDKETNSSFPGIYTKPTAYDGATTSGTQSRNNMTTIRMIDTSDSWW